MGLLSFAIWTPIAFGCMLLLMGREEDVKAVRWLALIGALAGLAARGMPVEARQAAPAPAARRAMKTVIG